MDRDLSYYCRKFAKLNVSRSAGVAPNKPILLLSVIESIARGDIRQNQIVLSGELIATFLNLWSHLVADRKPDIGQPFFHLRGDKFWHHVPNPGFEATVASKTPIRGLGNLRSAIAYAYLDRELFRFLQQPDTRSILTQTLLDTWFGERTGQVEQLMQENAFGELQAQLQEQGGKVYPLEELQDETEEKAIVRDGAFRKIVVASYEYRCAFCGLQVLNSLGQNIVDGAHIKPFSQFRDDRIDNGLSLCKNHHWAFDRFWFAIDDDYSILVSEDLQEDSPHGKPMREFRGERIRLPSQERYYPRLDALRWHREVFLEGVG
ncbi:HNH endonuclease [Oscillatoriales cyanobacterium LEGE 11467]|uniref:HNH endonuclease n=1 Tax=Zarconia navalis LEGE 11467 TaxID=1828826 RepID=A0A928Z819_9CYAN|nr:HNH endonuclease [Zarconia navalis]MBE9039371.1 HNH endonuclease [Zarconia navalis LEGE 11467]